MPVFFGDGSMMPLCSIVYPLPSCALRCRCPTMPLLHIVSHGRIDGRELVGSRQVSEDCMGSTQKLERAGDDVTDL